ncbi:diphthine synthase [Sulfodiicoccus acidiphilus]|nr:diphthine synthase [Sulfodiicoccus acidiphilus]
MPGRLYLVGLGLSSNFLTQATLDALRSSDVIFLDGYTSISCDLNAELISKLTSKEVIVAKRSQLEDEAKQLLKLAELGNVVSIASIGDPMIATTHAALAVDAMSRGIEVKIVPGISVFCYAVSKSMLSSYKFGRSVTITYPTGIADVTAIKVIESNFSQGLHTLTFLDIKDDKPMRVSEAFDVLREQQSRLGRDVLGQFQYVVVESRLGCPDEKVSVISVNEADEDVGSPPYVIIFPSRLHFMEVDALKWLRFKREYRST